jgi:hypothetical protein
VTAISSVPNRGDGKHGERQPATPAKPRPTTSFSMMRVVHQLRSPCEPSNVPLASIDTNGSVRYITASLIESVTHLMAHVYKLDPVATKHHLHKWSAHSLRVGAWYSTVEWSFTDRSISPSLDLYCVLRPYVTLPDWRANETTHSTISSVLFYLMGTPHCGPCSLITFRLPFIGLFIFIYPTTILLFLVFSFLSGLC